MKKKIAVDSFKNGCNCSQAVIKPYAEQFGVDFDVVERMAVAFGGGMARQGSTCGCVTGALMVLGLQNGSGSSTKPENRLNTYNISGDFLKKFKEEYGALDCRDLLKLDAEKTAGMSGEEKRKILAGRCADIVGKTVEILDKDFIK